MHVSNDKAQDFIALEERYGAHNYHPLDIVVERAEGVWLYDVEGKRYLDCISAYSAVNQGHGHPRIAAALHAQADKLALVSRALRNDRLPGFLKKLTELCRQEVALPTNSGVEAVETAIKLARRWGYDVKGIPADKAEIVVFTNNFHGRTTAAISASSTAEYRRGFGPFTPGFVFVPFGDYDALAAAINDNTCAILIEPIQGEGGVIVPPAGYLKRAWGLCREHRVLFIADEVQTGFGRTGDLFACDHDGISPDILVVGKALGGGFYPVSAALASHEIMDLFRPGDHGSTFGGNPLASAVACAAMEVIVDERLADRARVSGETITAGIRAMQSPLVADVRGRGLLIGVELTVSARTLAEKLLERGVAAKDTHDNVLRIAPPLIIDDAAIAFFLSAFRDALATLHLP
ncbi:MAG: ornithine--oxo-acid transaminase [Candidatus Eremiobacteraeota bacterium]|nr:ornithine--oxo-acid transaminase [Candidatus Eremiobacteraeota bacterium]